MKNLITASLVGVGACLIASGIIIGHKEQKKNWQNRVIVNNKTYSIVVSNGHCKVVLMGICKDPKDAAVRDIIELKTQELINSGLTKEKVLRNLSIHFTKLKETIVIL